MTKPMLNANGRRGFTLTELAIVLLVAGAVVGAIWVAGGAVWSNYRIYRFSQQVITAVKNIRDQYANAVQLPAGPDITKTLDGLNLLPVEMRRDPSKPGNTEMDDPFNNDLPGGSFHVLVEAPPTPPVFRIEAQGLTQEPCIKLLTLQPLADAELGVVRIGTTTNSMAVAYNTATLPLPPSTAETWCGNAGNTNEVDWDFEVRN